jgi:MoaA/NifB/PqqE/SkfB family radical SAM enzyme
MYNYYDIQHIQLEITTVCNAACPQCPRNHHGGPVISSLPIITWDLNDVKRILPVDFIRQLKTVYMCGTYGDPMANKNILDICYFLKKINPNVKISLHTNGSVGSSKIYKSLAKIVDYIAFGIDGLADTNHLYRRNTMWNKLITNVESFINDGGNAIWDFIVFRHNEHQVIEAELLSKQLGFKRFNVKKTYRFFNRNHQFIPLILVDGFKLEPPSNPLYQNQPTSILHWTNLEKYKKSTKISCHYLKEKSIYIGADGYVFPCGWLHDRLYGIESELNIDHSTIEKMMIESGGKSKANCFDTQLVEIVNGHWFKSISDGWESNRIERCSIMCGRNLNFIANQNELVTY